MSVLSSVKQPFIWFIWENKIMWNYSIPNWIYTVYSTGFSYIDLDHHFVREIRGVFMLSVHAYISLDSTHFRPMLDCIVALEAWYLSMEWMILDHDSITWGYLTIGYPWNSGPTTRLPRCLGSRFSKGLAGKVHFGESWNFDKLKNKTRETMELVSWQVIMRGHFQSPLVTWQTSIRCKVTTYIFIHVWDRLRIDIQGTSKNLSSKFTSLAGTDRFLQRFQRFAPETEKNRAFSSGSCRRPRSAWLPTLEYGVTTNG